MAPSRFDPVYTVFKVATFVAMTAVLYYGFLAVSLYPKLRNHAPMGYEGLVTYHQFTITLVSALTLHLVKKLVSLLFTPVIKSSLKD